MAVERNSLVPCGTLMLMLLLMLLFVPELPPPLPPLIGTMLTRSRCGDTRNATTLLSSPP
jgi:hypothetical protein